VAEFLQIASTVAHFNRRYSRRAMSLSVSMASDVELSLAFIRDYRCQGLMGRNDEAAVLCDEQRAQYSANPPTFFVMGQVHLKHYTTTIESAALAPTIRSLFSA